MVNKKIIFLLSSLLVLDNCIYAGEGEKPAKKQKTSDNSESENSGDESDSDSSPTEHDWDSSPSMRLWESLIEGDRDSFPAFCRRLTNRGATDPRGVADPNFRITPIDLDCFPESYEDTSMISYALLCDMPLCVLRALIEGGADLYDFINDEQLVRSFIQVAGGKADEDAVWILKKLLANGLQVEDDFMAIFLGYRPDMYYDEPEARREFVGILLENNPLCANESTLNAQLTECVQPGARVEGRHNEDEFSDECFESDCAILDMTRRAGNLSLDCLSPDAERWSLEAINISNEDKDQGYASSDLTAVLRRSPRAPAKCSSFITVLAARLFRGNQNDGVCKPNKVVLDSSEIIKQFKSASEICRHANPDLGLLNRALSPKFFPSALFSNNLKLCMTGECDRLSNLVCLSSNVSVEMINDEMQLVSRSPHKRSDAMRGFIQALMAGKTEIAYNCMPVPEDLDHGFNPDKARELLELQCMNPQLSPTSAARLLFAFGRCFNLKQPRLDYRAIDGIAVANHDRLLLSAQGGSSAAPHFGIGGSSFAQAGGGAAVSSVSPKAVLLLKDNPEKLDKKNKQDHPK